MHIVIQDEDKSVRTTDVSDTVTCVLAGSSPDCHVYLPDVRVAERQFQIRRDESNVWWLERCKIPDGSTGEHTRIYLNALEATETRQVKHHDVVELARFRLKVHLEEVDADVPVAEVMEEASRLRERPLPAGTLIRSDARADVILSRSAVEVVAASAFQIHECADLASLMSAAIARIAEQLSAHQVWIGTRRRGYGRLESTETRLSDGRTSGEPPRLDTFTYRCVERGQFICCVQAAEPEIESVMCIPLVGKHSILGMLYVDNKAGSVPYSAHDLDLLTVLGVCITRQLEAILHEQVKHQEAIAAGELSFMRELQSCMDPTSVPQWSGLQLAVYCKPGLDSAGDIYDVMRLPNGLAAFMCGHVTGAPTTAALAMAEVRASFRIASLHADPPHVLWRALNWMLYDPRHPATLSAVGLVMNPKTGAMQYATAGRIGALVVGQRGAIRSLWQPEAPEVGASGEYVFNSGAGRLQEGETMMLYTPGCVTVTDRDHRPLGDDKLREALSDGFGQPASAALDELLSDLKAFFRDGRQPDDITIMMLHREHML